MKKRRGRRTQLATLIVVGEGPHDQAFINHMKELYDHRETGQKVKVESADGGSPQDIIRYVVKKKHIDYDRRVILMDSDIPLQPQDEVEARKSKITIIQSTPHCLEGMLLDILGEKSPVNSQACKARLHPRLNGSPAAKESYASLFPKPVLDRTPKQQIVELRTIISNGN